MQTEKYDSQIEVVYEWWTRMQGARVLGDIRRGRTTTEVIVVPEIRDLVGQFTAEDCERATVLAGVLTWVHEDDGRHVARTIGCRSSNEPNSGLVHQSRFNRLIRSDEPDALMDAMRRIVRMTNFRANVRDLSEFVLAWGKEDSDKIKQRWIFDYYNLLDELADRQEITDDEGCFAH